MILSMIECTRTTMIPVYRLILVDNKVTLQTTEETLPVYSKKEIERKAYKFLVNRIKKRPISLPRVVDFIREYVYKNDKFRYNLGEISTLFSQEDLNRQLRKVAKEFIEFNDVEEKEYIITSLPKDDFFSLRKNVYDDCYSDISLDFYAAPYEVQEKYKFVRIYSISKFYKAFHLKDEYENQSYFVNENYKNSNIKPLIFSIEYMFNFSSPKRYRIPKIIFENEISFINIKKSHLSYAINSEIFILNPKTFKITPPLNFSAYISLLKRELF